MERHPMPTMNSNKTQP